MNSNNFSAREPRLPRRTLMGVAVSLVAALGAAQATTPAAPADKASAPPQAASATFFKEGSKEILVDTPTASGSAAPTGAMVPTPGAPQVLRTGAVAVKPTQVGAATRASTAAQDAALAKALAELGLDMLRSQSAQTGDAQVNGVVSPLSLASALGMIHAGTSGAGSKELARLLGTSPTSGQRAFVQRLPSTLDRLASPQAKRALTMANRVWVDKGVADAVPNSYAATVTDRFDADGMMVSFTQAEAARKSINAWVADKTAQKITNLMPEGSITANTRLVVTNAIHFKSPWVTPFSASQTKERPFFVAPKSAKPVLTMIDEREVLTGMVDNITVFELPFAGDEFVLRLGMPPAGHSLDAFEKDLDGAEMAEWGRSLKPSTCRLELPKFNLAPVTRALKPTLQDLGVNTVFGPDADLSVMLGKAAKGVYVDNIYQSATMVLDEQGGEAAAATGGAAQAKSFSMPAPACPVNRPFIFAVVHKPTGAPLFVGKVADPSKP